MQGDSHLHVARYCHIIDWANSSSRTRRNEEEERKRRRAQPERPSPTGEEDEEEGKGPDHLAGEGEKGRCNRLPRPSNQPAVVQSCDIDRFSFIFARFALPSSMEDLSDLVGGDQNDQTVQPSAADQNDQVVQSPAADQK
ncbi:hypothetical protein OIU74_024762 [Salix koriyanagi]|uniref:Uncharacterized protein n=1 Tax=Salix koriyanagi TaxID=2511006 RepID=A0A9Q0W845_9ROSI|nr:hypothetical protein OIU74_024762 [Salix koriyanagi]